MRNTRREAAASGTWRVARGWMLHTLLKEKTLSTCSPSMHSCAGPSVYAKCSYVLSTTSHTPCAAHSALASSSVARGIMTPVGLPGLHLHAARTCIGSRIWPLTPPYVRCDDATASARRLHGRRLQGRMRDVCRGLNARAARGADEMRARTVSPA
jgi:hypothetical protein